MIDFINKWWHVIALGLAIALSIIHFRDDVRMMKYIQTQHDNQIKELLHNQNVTLEIVAKHVNSGGN